MIEANPKAAAAAVIIAAALILTITFLGSPAQNATNHSTGGDDDHKFQEIVEAIPLTSTENRYRKIAWHLVRCGFTDADFAPKDAVYRNLIGVGVLTYRSGGEELGCKLGPGWCGWWADHDNSFLDASFVMNRMLIMAGVGLPEATIQAIQASVNEAVDKARLKGRVGVYVWSGGGFSGTVEAVRFVRQGHQTPRIYVNILQHPDSQK